MSNCIPEATIIAAKARRKIFIMFLVGLYRIISVEKKTSVDVLAAVEA